MEKKRVGIVHAGDVFRRGIVESLESDPRFHVTFSSRSGLIAEAVDVVIVSPEAFIREPLSVPVVVCAWRSDLPLPVRADLPFSPVVLERETLTAEQLREAVLRALGV